MAQGLAVELPLHIDSADGAYSLHKNIEDVAKQNLKMIVLTSPGERVMEPNFGVGIRSYLFAQNTPSTINTIRTRIANQVKTYLPYIQITDLRVENRPVSPGSSDIDKTFLSVGITFNVPSANVASDLTIPIEI